jgi:hypothetical protein
MSRCGRAKEDSLEGEVYCESPKLKDKPFIDDVLVDYLCKSLTDSLFYGDKKYVMSQSLKVTMEPYIDQVDEEDKIRSKS